MNEMHVSILELVVLFGAAAIAATAFHLVRIPTLVGLILTGMLIGPGGFSLVPHLSSTGFLTELGTILLMFTIGLEISLSTMRRLMRSFLGLGSIQVLATIAVVTFFYFHRGWDVYSATFLGFLVSLSSTALIFKMLTDSRDLQSNQGNCLVGVLIFQDLAVIPMMLSLPLLASASPLVKLASPHTLTLLATNFVAGIVFVWVGSRFVLPFLFEQVLKTRSREIFYFCVLFVIFGIGYIAQHLGFSLSLGAFLAGFMISESPYGKQALSDVLVLRDSFLGLFFLTIGMMIDPMFILSHPTKIATMAAALIFVKAMIVYIGARILQFNHTVSVTVALTLAHVGEFSFILAAAGKAVGLIEEHHFQFFLCTSMVTLMLTPLLYKLGPKLATRDRFNRFLNLDAPGFEVPEVIQAMPNFSQVDPSQKKSENHTIIIGYGIAGENLSSALDDLGLPFSVIDMNYTAVKKQKSKNIFFGDASQSEILYHAGIDKARLVVITVSSIDMTKRVLETVKQIRADIHCIVRIQYLLDVQNIHHTQNVDIVVAEFETSLEILARALKVYGVPSQKLHSFLQSARSHASDGKHQISDSLRSSIELPAWEALSSIRPLKVPKNSLVIGRSLAEINLRSQTGASIVAIFREGRGTQMPEPDFKLESADILHIIGSAKALKEAEMMLAEKM